MQTNKMLSELEVSLHWGGWFFAGYGGGGGMIISPRQENRDENTGPIPVP